LSCFDAAKIVEVAAWGAASIRRRVTMSSQTCSLGRTTEGASMPRRFLVERAGERFDLVESPAPSEHHLQLVSR
jgi:hypothetical protein